MASSVRVTSKLGHIKVGWRRSVINIDWKDSALKVENKHRYSESHPKLRLPTGEELFPNESVTKFETGIHAWGYEKLTEYLKVLAKHKALQLEE